jgi:hypothetical protein
LDLERPPGPPRGGPQWPPWPRSDPPGCWRCNGANVGQYHLFRGTPGPPRGGAAVDFGPVGCFGARGLALGGAGAAACVSCRTSRGCGRGGGEIKIGLWFFVPGLEISLEQTH